MGCFLEIHASHLSHQLVQHRRLTLHCRLRLGVRCPTHPLAALLHHYRCCDKSQQSVLHHEKVVSLIVSLKAGFPLSTLSLECRVLLEDRDGGLLDVGIVAPKIRPWAKHDPAAKRRDLGPLGELVGAVKRDEDLRYAAS